MLQLLFHVLLVRILHVHSILQQEHHPDSLIKTIVTMAATRMDPADQQATDGQSHPRQDGGGETLAMMNNRAGKQKPATPGVYPDVRHAHAPRRLIIRQNLCVAVPSGPPAWCPREWASALLPGPRGKFRCIFTAKLIAYCS